MGVGVGVGGVACSVVEFPGRVHAFQAEGPVGAILGPTKKKEKQVHVSQWLPQVLCPDWDATKPVVDGTCRLCCATLAQR